jgi:sterol desaturase/sphingolipid hydroxylase (fatty acid hydroxylase superfamily)
MAIRADTVIGSIVQRLVWPLCVVANTVSILLAAIWFPQFLSPVAAAATVALLLLLIIVEQKLPYRTDWSIRNDPDIWRDLGHTLAYAAVAVNATRVLVLVVLAAGMTKLGGVNLFGIWPTSAPQWLQVVLVIVVGDALEYLFHRASHVHPWLWRIHVTHHTPVRLSAVKGARHHFLYAVGRGVMVWLPLLVLGAPASLVYWQFIAETIVGLPAHANIRFRLPAWLHRVAVTPEFHRIHHAADRRLGNTNFGVVFPFWDMACGTHSDPRHVVVRETGIEDDAGV